MLSLHASAVHAQPPFAPGARRRVGGRVLLVNRVAHLGGVERVILTLAAGLRRQGYDALLACPGRGDLPDAARDAGVEVLPCDFDRMRITANPLNLLGYPRAWLRGAADVARHCRERRINLLHTHHPVGTLYASRAARRLGLPLVQHVHEVLPARLPYTAALRFAGGACDRFLCVSGAGRALLESAGINPERADVVHNGVDPSFLGLGPPEPAPEVVGAGPHIGVFGVIEPRKGQHVFLETAAQLAERIPSARFWVVGKLALEDKAGHLRRLRAMADAPALRGRVVFTGHRRDVARYMRAMDVVVQASTHHESLSMALIEALSLGCRIVATDVGGTAEVITHGETGLLVPPGDAGALGAAVERMLARGAAGYADRALADSARFAPDVFCARVARIFDDVVRAGRGGVA